MWKAIKNIGAAVKDICIVAGKEVAFQSGRASNKTNNATEKLAAKTAAMRENYEVNLANRKDHVDGEIIIVRKHQDSEA
jgi:hypothetical protein